MSPLASEDIKRKEWNCTSDRVQGLCESRGGRPGFPVLTSLMVFVNVKQYSTMITHWSQLVRDMLTDIRDIKQHNNNNYTPV